MKKVFCIWWIMGLFCCFRAQADLPPPRKLAPLIPNWTANASLTCPTGFLVAGEQQLSSVTTRMVLIHTDSSGILRWARTYPQLLGRAGGYSLAANERHTLVGGMQGERAKLWEINPRQGDLGKEIDLGIGLVRSVAFLTDNRLCVTIENGTLLEVRCLELSGKTCWKKLFVKSPEAESRLITTSTMRILLAFDGTSLALNDCGEILWQQQQKQVVWRGFYERNNGDILLFGRRKVEIFGLESEDALLVSLNSDSGQSDWFRHYGSSDTPDEASFLIERPNDQILFVSEKNQRLHLTELDTEYSIVSTRNIGDSLSGFHYQVAGILNQSAWQDKLLFVYNRSDGTVWLQPSSSHESPEYLPTDIGFRLTVRSGSGESVYPRPIHKVPTTYRLESPCEDTYTIHFADSQGDGYAYLLSQDKRDSVWQERGWVQLGRRDSLLLRFTSWETRHMVMVASRPFADPVGLVQESAAFQADSLRPVSSAISLSEQYPDTFGKELIVKVSSDGGHFQIKNLPPDGWVPILLTYRKKYPNL